MKSSSSIVNRFIDFGCWSKLLHSTFSVNYSEFFEPLIEDGKCRSQEGKVRFRLCTYD